MIPSINYFFYSFQFIIHQFQLYYQHILDFLQLFQPTYELFFLQVPLFLFQYEFLSHIFIHKEPLLPLSLGFQQFFL